MSAPVAATLSGSIALTVAAVPTGMKAGVRICPRGVSMTPLRAAPSVAVREKEKRGVIVRPAIGNRALVALRNLRRNAGHHWTTAPWCPI